MKNDKRLEEDGTIAAAVGKNTFDNTHLNLVLQK